MVAQVKILLAIASYHLHLLYFLEYGPRYGYNHTSGTTALERM